MDSRLEFWLDHQEVSLKMLERAQQVLAQLALEGSGQLQFEFEEDTDECRETR